MSKTTALLSGTTALIPVGVLARDRSREVVARETGIVMNNVSVTNCGVGIMIRHRHECPAIENNNLPKIEGRQPQFITRHIESKYLPSARKGYFRFGTLVRYRGEEGEAVSRLGDHQESRQQEVFNSRSQFFEHARFGELQVSNSSFHGTPKQVLIETVVNDYCSCSSSGPFSMETGLAFRDFEANPDKKPGAYVTYDLSKLRSALEIAIRRDRRLANLTLVGRLVEYGDKDRHWTVEENYHHRFESDAVAIWLGIAFVKDPKFLHEKEYRLLLVDLLAPGGLHEDSELDPILEDAGIASTIVASDYY